MDLTSTDKIKRTLAAPNLNPKDLCDWNQNEESEQLMVTLKELQLSLETEMSQSI